MYVTCILEPNFYIASSPGFLHATLKAGRSREGVGVRLIFYKCSTKWCMRFFQVVYEIKREGTQEYT